VGDPVEMVEALAAERACERLMVDYAWAVDSGRAADIAELFTEDGVWEAGGGVAMVGRDAIREGFARRQDVVRRTSRHVITNQAVDLVSADEATGRCYLVNFRHDGPDGVAVVPAPADHPKYVGEYHLRYARTPQGWRLRSLRVELAFVRARLADEHSP
jgi:ketosteroid isomerase-like protein